MKEWKDDKTLITLIKAELYTAVIGDIMDKMGYLHQFLPPHIRPLRDDMLIAGRAMTVLEADVHDNSASGGNNPLLQRSFGLMLEALDDLKEDEVYICSGSSPEYALWGELMSARAMQCKAAGAVVNGYSRDTKGILALDFPCFSYGPYAQDQAPRGKVIDYRVPIEVDGVLVNDGDMLSGGVAEKYDIKVNLCGGGFTGQSQALRLAISPAILVELEPEQHRVNCQEGCFR